MRPAEETLFPLVDRIAAGDEVALEELCRGTRMSLLRAIRMVVYNASDAEEVLQDVYRQVWLTAAQYCTGRGGVWCWLTLIARSRALDRLRRTRRRQLEVPMEEWPAYQSTPEWQYLDSWWRGRLRRQVVGLPESQRELVELAFYEGYSHSEIASRQGLPIGTVKTRIRSALGKMKESLAA